MDPTLSDLPQATGNASYTEKAQALRQRLASSIPESLRLPSTLLDNLPLDVTSIPASCGLLTPEELALTDLDATAIRDKIAAGKLTCVEVVTAFGKRAAIAHQLVHCLVDYFLDEGIARAKELDEYFKREGKVVGPLHGVPISIKDHVPLKGHYASAGFLSTVEVSAEDCDMTSILRELGAVFYVKTNQPQTVMHLESHSVYGRTLNPRNLNTTPGGSSGGESALIAMQGSPLGIGTDGGGSIRNPCANTGIYGMRPTGRTMPTKGYLAFADGHMGFYVATGPMCRSARDIDMFFSAVRSAHPELRDPSQLPSPWTTLPQGRKLRVGVMVYDDVVLPQPPMIRALEWARKKLEAADNIEVVDYKPYCHPEGYAIIREMWYEDGGNAVRRLLKEGGEDSMPLTDWVIEPSAVKDHDTQGIWDLHGRRDKFRQRYWDQWKAQGCDVVLLPPFPGSANLHDRARHWSYTAIWNAVDYPGVVFPSGLTVDPALDALRASDYVPVTDADKANYADYDVEKMVGSPLSLQLVARRFEDGMLLAAQHVVEEALKRE
ncbi:hypothetical protein PLICRDRAFT_116709 [Plicaturopsis crispa FD-325 SS-3]|uniref:amidase n=1 Tax=Plicaturopsis crispa FD-325 SS-3 TaxID=944288 RepID=A0A0C9SYM9_PLICR|nr:hypothetical protein PLICRDRAFT_116709 [Plicaturopsis crispa FD-325 SS-3]